MSYSLGDFIKVDRKILKMGTITRIYEGINAYQVMCAHTMKYYTVSSKEIKEKISGEKLNKLARSRNLFFPPPTIYKEKEARKKRKK